MPKKEADLLSQPLTEKIAKCQKMVVKMVKSGKISQSPTMPQKRATTQSKIKIYKYRTTYHKTPYRENLNRHKQRDKQRQRNKCKAKRKTTPTTPKKRDQSATTCRRIYSHTPKKEKRPTERKNALQGKKKNRPRSANRERRFLYSIYYMNVCFFVVFTSARYLIQAH